MPSINLSPWIRDEAPLWRSIVKPDYIAIYEKDALIFTQGDTPSYVCFLDKGRVQLTVASTEGEEKIIMFAGDGALFGERLDKDAPPLPYSAYTLATCRIYRMPREQFVQHLCENSDICLWVMEMLLQKERVLSTQIALLTFSNTLGRIAYELICSAQIYGVHTSAGIRIDLPITHQDLCHKVGATRSTVSGSLKLLSQQGIIGTTKRALCDKKSQCPSGHHIPRPLS